VAPGSATVAALSVVSAFSVVIFVQSPSAAIGARSSHGSLRCCREARDTFLSVRPVTGTRNHSIDY
jgi:hypothetical protein